MQEKLALQLLRDRRITVDEALALLGHQPAPTETPQPRPTRIRRNKKTQRHYTNEDHQRIVETYLGNGGDAAETARVLGMTRTSLNNHLKYAGLVPCASTAEVERVVVWRTRRGLYTHLGRPEIGQRSAFVKAAN